MNHRRFWCTLSAVPILCCFGCGGSQPGRIGPAFPLPNGEPRTACEREEWYELAPARVKLTAVTTGIGYDTVYTAQYEGVGVFRKGDDAPEELEDLWPRIGEPELQSRHESRIKPVDDASARTAYWAFGGLIGMGAGLGGAAALAEESRTGAIVIGVSGLVVGVVGLVGALASQPSGEEQLEANARRRLMVKGEDDLAAARRGVNRLNGTQRAKCGGANAVE